MTKYVRGMKRNQIIQRWLQGIEDPEYEVFPTKRDGKYIVKPRQSPIEEPVSQTELSPTIDDSTIKPVSDQSQSDPDDSIDPEPTPKSTIHKNPMSARQYKAPIQRSNYDSISMLRNTKGEGNFAPQTMTRRDSSTDVNLEILEQLRNLGEELRNDRFKREQKQYIKQVVNKELTKSRIRSKYVPDTLIDNDPDHPKSPEPKDTTDNEQIDSISMLRNTKGEGNFAPQTPIQPEIEQIQIQPIFRSRIRR